MTDLRVPTDYPDRADVRAALTRRTSVAALVTRRARVAARRRAHVSARALGPVLKRGTDLAVAAAGLVLALPVVLPVLAWLVANGRAVERLASLGRDAQPFERWTMALPRQGFGGRLRAWHLHHVASLVQVLLGHMSIVGPRAARVSELSPRSSAARPRYAVRPGLVGPWWVRRRANIAYGAEVDADRDYVASWSAGGDLALLARAALAALYGAEAPRDVPPRISMLGVAIDNLTMNGALTAIDGWLDDTGSRQAAFVNADCLNLAYARPAYRGVLAKAALTLGDGIGLKVGGRLLDRPIRQNVNGTDLFPHLCRLMDLRGARLYLLGGRPGVADALRAWVEARYPHVVVCGTQHGYFSAAEEAGIIDAVREARPHVLLVAFGAPRQDEWLASHLAATGARVGIGVGGLFDFYSGRIPRAPMWIRELGLEWIYRLYQEPRRMWRRYLVGNVVFLARILRERRSETKRRKVTGNARTLART